MKRGSKPIRPNYAQGERAIPQYLIVGRIRTTHGIHGELKVQPTTEQIGQVLISRTLYLSRHDWDDQPKPVSVEQIREHGDELLVKLQGYDSPEAASALRQWVLQLPFADFPPLGHGEYYLFQVLGGRVETIEGEFLGYVTDVLETGANRVFVVQGDLGELLLPDVPHVILQVDAESGRVLVRLLDGLLPPLLGEPMP